MDILDKRTELLLYACASIVFGLLALDAIQRPALYNPYPIGGFGVTILSITFACIFAVKLEKDKKKPSEKTKDRYCPNCGRNIPFNTNICPYCKHDFEESV